MTYLGYPMFLVALGRVRGVKVHKKDILPHISIIISAYNEEKDIERKILNTLALDYPPQKRQILIGSDGSKDNTASIVNKYLGEGITFFDYKVNKGKTTVQNELVRNATGEILVFTDAASFLPQDAVRKLVRNFGDPRIGGVAGRMRFINTDKNITTESQGLYWRYEIKIRELEARIGSLIGVDGPLYAVRRDCYVPLGANIISDLMTPLLVLGQGKQVILEPEALVDEEPTQKTTQEFTSRRRIVLRGLIGIFSFNSLLNPRKHPLLSFQIVFHKVVRWFVGPLILVNVLSCLLLYKHEPFQIIIFCYAFFFGAALLGWSMAKSGVKIKLFTVPYYFCLVNLAATFAIVDFIRRKQAVTWKTER